MPIKHSSVCPQTAVSDENDIWKGEVFIVRCSQVATKFFTLLAKTLPVSDVKEKTGFGLYILNSVIIHSPSSCSKPV